MLTPIGRKHRFGNPPEPWYHGNALQSSRYPIGSAVPSNVPGCHRRNPPPIGPRRTDVSPAVSVPPLREGPSGSGGPHGRPGHAIWGDAMIDEGDPRGRGPGRAGRDHRARAAVGRPARRAPLPRPARPARRTRAHPSAERDHGLSAGGLAESVVREVLDRRPPAAGGRAGSGRVKSVRAGASLRVRNARRYDAARPDGPAVRVERSVTHVGCAPPPSVARIRAGASRVVVGGVVE